MNALGQPQKMLAQAEQCITAGAKVGIITDIDRGTSISIQKKFRAVGGKTIDYDRQIIGGTGSVYISFDNPSVGRQQALGVLGGMKENGTYRRERRRSAQLWGGPTDANAFAFKSGNDAVLNPLFKAKKIKRGPAKFVPLWDAGKAQTIFEQMLVQTSNNIQGVVAANDGIAGAVVATLKAKGLKPIPLSGQDATVQGVQNIISGWQTTDRLQVRARRGQRGRGGGDCPVQGGEAEGQLQRARGSLRTSSPCTSITKANYTRLFRERVPQAERGVLRGVQAVLQVVG